MLERLNKIIAGGGYLIFCEAGGKSAMSTYQYVKNYIPKERIIMQDIDDSILEYWKSKGIITSVAIYELLSKYNPNQLFLMPCSEVTVRIAYNFNVAMALTKGNPTVVHNKLKSYLAVRDKCTYVQTPRLFEDIGGVVVRGIHSSGSKETYIYDDTHIVTEYIEGVEYEVDFNTYAGTIHPLLSHSRKNGYNNYVSLIGALNPMYKVLKKGVEDITNALEIEGVGTVQFIYSKSKLYYVEAALRIHGSSKVFALKGGNPVLGLTGDINFNSEDVICDLGSI